VRGLNYRFSNFLGGFRKAGKAEKISPIEFWPTISTTCLILQFKKVNLKIFFSLDGRLMKIILNFPLPFHLFSPTFKRMNLEKAIYFYFIIPRYFDFLSLFTQSDNINQK